MMKIWSLKKTEAAERARQPKASAAQIRLQKDLTELEIPSTMKMEFPDPANVLQFNLDIEPDEDPSWLFRRRSRGAGMYKGGLFHFTFVISPSYPHEPPKVKCTQKLSLVHSLATLADSRFRSTTRDLAGNVCLNILREDWKPVLNLNAVMVGLQYLFLEARVPQGLDWLMRDQPNADDPLNKTAAEDLRRDRATFAQNVKISMRGQAVGGEPFDRVLAPAK